MASRMTAEDTEWLLNQQQRQEVLGAIEEACHELCELALTSVRVELQSTVAMLAEATDAFVLTAISAMAEGDPLELDALERMTSGRGAAMEAFRRRYLASSDDVPAEARTQLLRLTSLFERVAWSLGRFAQLLRVAPVLAELREPAIDTQAEPAAPGAPVGS